MKIEEIIESKILELSEITGVVKKDLLDLEKKGLKRENVEVYGNLARFYLELNAALESWLSAYILIKENGDKVPFSEKYSAVLQGLEKNGDRV